MLVLSVELLVLTQHLVPFLRTAFSVAQGIEPEIAISTIAVPVATLLTYLDILGRMTTTYFAHRIDAAIERFDYKGIERNYLLGAVPWALSRALPVFLALAFGGAFVQSVVDFVAKYQWFANGLTLAGRMLPGLGFAILLRYLPVKRQPSLSCPWFWLNSDVDSALQQCSKPWCCNF